MIPARPRSFLVALAGTALAALLTACSPSVPDTMKIGVLAPQTGTFALRGKDLVNGARLAVDELNASGYTINGKAVKFELVAFDDKGDVEAAKQGAQQFVDADVTAIIGPLNTPQAAPVMPIVAAKGTPQFFTATGAELTGLANGNAFRLLANDDLQGKAMAVFANDNLHAKRIATIVETGAYGRGLNKAFVASLPKGGAQVVFTTEVDTKEEVSADTAAKIKAADADLVVLFAREPQLTSLFAALQKVGHTGVTVLGTNVVRNKNVASQPVPVKAFYATATAIDATEFAHGPEFLDAFQKKYGSAPVWGAHYAYDAVYALADALRRSPSVKSADVLATIKRIDPATRVLQNLRFTESGEQRYPNIGVYKVERGIWAPQLVSASW
ncbi:MAG TPA: branched-chain amino acid ABC transporter substrate-binding protein [Burkholderiaceae bacterium]|nr:branched-chain amino acid ABC transporter substrate-binding protein [Burkholderiaceae bacterium]